MGLIWQATLNLFHDVNIKNKVILETQLQHFSDNEHIDYVDFSRSGGRITKIGLNIYSGNLYGNTTGILLDLTSADRDDTLSFDIDFETFGEKN